MRDETFYERLSALDQTFLAFETSNAPMHVAMTGDLRARIAGHRRRAASTSSASAATSPRGCASFRATGSADHAAAVQRRDLGRRRRVRPRLSRPPRQPAAAGRRAPVAAPLRRDPRAPARSRAGRCGSCGSSRGSRAAASRWSPRCTTAWSTASPASTCWRRCSAPSRARPSSRSQPWRPRPGAAASATCSSTSCAGGRARRSTRRAGSATGCALRARPGALPAPARRAFVRLLGKLGGAPGTPFNQPIGPHRRVDWFSISLADDEGDPHPPRRHDQRRRAHHRGRRGRPVPGQAARAILDGEFRTVVPVSVRAVDERGATGNRVSVWLTTLPVTERDRAPPPGGGERRDRGAEGGSGRDGRRAAHPGGRVHHRQRRQPGRAPDQQLPPLQPDRHQRAGPAGAVLPARRAHGGGLSAPAAVRESGPRRRAVELRRHALVGHRRRLEPDARPAPIS